MGKGRYVVYERASRDEERTFLSIAKEIVAEVKEPREWAPRDPKKHPGARPSKYGFRPMLLVLLLMVYHRKEYRGMMEAPPEGHSVQRKIVGQEQNKDRR
jgi:hypothetical protein